MGEGEAGTKKEANRQLSGHSMGKARGKKKPKNPGEWCLRNSSREWCWEGGWSPHW